MGDSLYQQGFSFSDFVWGAQNPYTSTCGMSHSFGEIKLSFGFLPPGAMHYRGRIPGSPREKLHRDTLEDEKADGVKPVEEHSGIKPNRLPGAELPLDCSVRSRRRDTYKLWQDKINSLLF